MTKRLGRSRDAISSKISTVIDRVSGISDEMWDEIEEILIQADVGMDTTMKIIEGLRERSKSEKVNDKNRVVELLKQEMLRILPEESKSPFDIDTPLNVVLMVGVNGTGKTTSIAKMANLANEKGRKVLLAAADTFRAAAIEQLETWGKRVDVAVVKHERGGDAAAVVFDALSKAKAKGLDVLIVDTAGRLHTKVNLMEELKKIKRVAESRIEKGKLQTILCIDATSGQNVLAQTRMFDDALGVDGIVLTKLDGTAKGGIVLAIADQFKIPIKYIGIGEGLDDLIEFDSEAFITALISN